MTTKARVCDILPDLKRLAFPVEKLVPLPGNPRRGDVQAVATSYATFGQRKPIVARREGEGGIVIAGNHQLAAAKQLGWTHIAVAWVDDDDLTAKAFALADNRTADLGEYDDADLLALLQSVHDGDPKLFEATAYDEDALADLIRSLEPDTSTPGRDTEPGEPPAEPVTKPGDLICLGMHRLLCGDATVEEDVARLMDGTRASLMFTDPPYGVLYQSSKKNAISGDLSQAVIPVSFAVAVRDALDDDARLYICGGSGNWSMYAKLFDFHLRSEPHPLIWVKESFVMRPNGYHSQFELIYFGWKGVGGGPKFWYGDRKHSDVWQMTRRDGEEHVHPTQKPIELAARAIGNSSAMSATVYEPFGGSGSTLIAAENLQRSCFALELDPGYCDVIVDRWQRHTGQTAVRPD